MTASFDSAVALLNQGQFEQARDQLLKIVAARPRDFDAHHMLGVVYGQIGQFELAEKSFQTALSVDAKHPPLYQNYGLLLSKARRYREAIEKFDIAIKLAPDFPPVHSDRGNALKELGKLDEAIRNHNRAISLAPQFFGFYNNRGNALREKKEYLAALADYDRAIQLNPRYADAHNGRGNALFDLKRRDEATAAYDKALSINPDLAEAWLGRGTVLADHKRYDQAFAAYDKALSIKPDLEGAWLAGSRALFELGRYDEALAACDKALAVKPDYGAAWLSRGNILSRLTRIEEAFAAYDKAFSIDPNLEDLEGARLHSKLTLCRWDNLDAEIGALTESVRAGKRNCTPHTLLTLVDSPQDQLRCAETWVAARFPHASKPTSRQPGRAHEKIRIGYVSADFHVHPVSYLTAGLFEHHDTGRFETYAFAIGANDRSDLRRRLEASFSRFFDVYNQNDGAILDTIRNLEIDILVDLTGNTHGERPSLFQSRAAPIAVNYLGYAGTLGSAAIWDYIITDKIISPDDKRQFFAEKLVRLPGCLIPHDDKGREISDRPFERADHNLPSDGIVFCDFNNAYKINPGAFGSWMKILKRVDNSVLWLSDIAPAAKDNLRKAASSSGVNPDRLAFAKRLPSSAEHLARHRLADLFLDTFPYNAHTTASDALWAGLPVLTLAGNGFAGRIAASLVHNAGLPELIAHSREEYESLAIQLALDPERLKRLKEQLAKNRLTIPLFNTALYARHLEAAYEEMYRRYRAGLPPNHIDIDAVMS